MHYPVVTKVKCLKSLEDGLHFPTEYLLSLMYASHLYHKSWKSLHPMSSAVDIKYNINFFKVRVWL